MANPTNTYNNKTIGHLKKEVFKQKRRIESLEKSASEPNSGWEHHFNQKPWLVISGIVVVLVGAFWAAFTWQSGKHDAEVAEIKSEYKERMAWLKEQHSSNLSSADNRCKYDLKVLSDKHKSCETNLVKNNGSLPAASTGITSKGTGRDKAAPVL